MFDGDAAQPEAAGPPTPDRLTETVVQQGRRIPNRDDCHCELRGGQHDRSRGVTPVAADGHRVALSPTETGGCRSQRAALIRVNTATQLSDVG